MKRQLLVLVCAVASAFAQHPPHGAPAPTPQPPVDPPTAPPTPPNVCSYSIDRPQSAPNSDFKSGPNGLCNAHTSGILFQGEAKVWSPASFAAASSDYFSTALRHRPVTGCAPVSFTVDIRTRGRVRAAVQHSGTGSRHGTVQAVSSLRSSALDQTAAYSVHAHAQMAQPYQTTPPGAQTVGSQTSSVDDDNGIAVGTKTVEEDVWTGRSSVSLSVGTNNSWFGGALVEYSSVDATSSSRCNVHGVGGHIFYKDLWKTAYGWLF